MGVGIEIPFNMMVCHCVDGGNLMRLVRGQSREAGKSCYMWKCHLCGSAIVGAFMVSPGDGEWHPVTGPLRVPEEAQ